VILDGVPIRILNDQRVEVDDRVDPLKRPVLPRLFAFRQDVSVIFGSRSGETSVP